MPDAGRTAEHEPALAGSGDIVFADTITVLPDDAPGAVVICGSHSGRYPGYLAARSGVRAVILCDAGIGRDEAGIGALPYLDGLGIAAAAVASTSCRIGDTADMVARGRISAANAVAQRHGVEINMPTMAAAELLRAAPLRSVMPPALGEARSLARDGGGRRIWLVDSAALVEPGDAGHIVVTGSHGGLVGGRPEKALKVDAYAAVFNDAGVGVDQAGIARLEVLDRRGIAAFTVSAASARIGEARSSFEDGEISVVNRIAERLGARPLTPARDILLAWADTPDRP
ncbi:hypothetical protein [Oceanibacterium hippocampi]|uniref:Uncharacterized protein n=1 Tax=Oceanibacterium hippocampi TaxID=745714 RepID=A0A1Y5TY33_9PROT|nr:hypothetical protein [Oceanibacterium hippocampi]SLN76690.1 hypothetical protein OCH7691_04169 [Oceanibacterium hippocampi]